LIYDWNLNSLNLNLSNSRILTTTNVLAFQDNYILLEKSDYSIQLWSLVNQQFTYSGGFDSKIFKQINASMVLYNKLMLLPRQNILYIDYNGNNNIMTAYYYKLSHPTRNRLG